MVFLILGLGALVVIAIALVAVGGGVAKTAAMPDQVVYDVMESIDFCAEALPDEVTATLSYDDLRRTLRLHLEWIQAYHFTPDGDPAGPIVFNSDDALSYVMERAATTGLLISAENAKQVIEAHLAYFQFMGAVHIEDPELVTKDLMDFGILEAPDETPAIPITNDSDPDPTAQSDPTA